jgi:hypothetical protein
MRAPPATSGAYPARRVPRTERGATAPAWRIASRPDDLEEGLFGQVILWVFEILPWLDAAGIRPQWEIHSSLYGEPGRRALLPGLFDLAYVPEPAPASDGTRARSLLWSRVLHTSLLGGDWQGTHALWRRFFKVPLRIETRAELLQLPSDCLGLHYRGTDKNQRTIDTNPVSVDDFLALATAFLATRPAIRCVFVASDEPGFLALARERLAGREVRGLGDVPFHKAPGAAVTPGKADRALLDCVLLSRCSVVLKCSSALSGFAKVLNPDLECYRVAACKIFMDVPYFPDAYVPRLALDEPRAAAILARQFEGDWLDDPVARARWSTPFVARPRNSPLRIAINALKYGVSLLAGRPRKA